MRIHLYSRSFAPAVGGMERLMEVLAAEFVRQGHAVTAVTETSGDATLPYPVERAPGFARYLRLAGECDAILTAPLSLRRLPAQLLARRPIVAVHPILLPRGGLQGAISRAKRAIAGRLAGVVPSHFMARHFPGATVIPNPYDAATFFRPAGDAPRENILFVGRLVPEKGCDLLFRAFALAQTDGARLRVVGDGPERAALERLAADLGIAERVDFRGELAGGALAEVLQAHRVMVVPTLCEEAFGIVALEGLACGCRMIVAESGGLPEAVGPFALTFPRGDAAALAGCIDRALGAEDEPPALAEVDRHLDQFTPERIAARYLEVLGGG